MRAGAGADGRMILEATRSEADTLAVLLTCMANRYTMLKERASDNTAGGKLNAGQHLVASAESGVSNAKNGL